MATATPATLHQRQLLSDAMDFGVIIRSSGGYVFDIYGCDTEQGIRADEVLYVDLDEHGGASEPNLFGSGFSDGWELLTGFTGQYGYHGAIMHPSEYIGGGLADYILTTEGLFVAVVVDANRYNDENDVSDVETENVGWAVLHYAGDDI